MKKFNLLLAFQLLFLFSFSQSLLQKISGNGLKKPSYLLGTIHITNEDTIPVFEKAKNVLPKCKIFALEIKMDNPLSLLGLLDQMKIPNNKTIRDYLTEQEYVKLNTIFEEKTGFKLKLFEVFQPVFIEALLEVDTKGNEVKKSTMMDMELQSLAKKQKLKIIGLETAEEQLATLSNISIDDQVAALKAHLYSDTIQQETVSVNQMYLKNNATELYNWMAQKMKADEIKFMLTDRNMRMCERAIIQIQTQPTLIAIGAGHLGGENGLINLLRKKGYIVEDVPIE